MLDNQEKLIDKVRKLINKANSTDSQAEADALMLKANKILIDHNLSMSHIQKDIDGIVEDKYVVEFGDIKSEGNKWETLLMAVIAVNNMCDSIIHHKKGKTGGMMSVIGHRDNIDVVVYLYGVAKEMIRELSKRRYKEVREEILNYWAPVISEQELLADGTLPYRDSWIRNYLKGAVLGLNEKLQSQKKEMEDEHSRESRDGTSGEHSMIGNEFALMIVSNKSLLDKYKEEEYEDLSKAKTTTVKNRSAYTQGKADGEQINLSKGIDTSQESSKQLL